MSMNNLKVFTLLAGMTAVMGMVGQAMGGQSGMLIALLIAGLMNFYMYFTSSTKVMKAYKAQTITREQAPELYDIVDKLRQRAGLPMPTVGIAPQRQPNAFATGRNADHAVVCVTQGLLDMVDEDELEGVLAHEIGHIKNRDMLLQTISATMSGAITSLARFGLYSPHQGDGRGSPLGPLLALLAPIVAMILQFAISRTREFKADAVGAEISGKPLALASALQKMQQIAQRAPMDVPPSVAPIAQVNPLSGFRGLSRLFSTHPSTEERVARLQAIAAAQTG
jgi:heat shock protein HtpX